MTSALKIPMNLKAELMTVYYPATLNFKGCYRRRGKSTNRIESPRLKATLYRNIILKLCHVNFYSGILRGVISFKNLA